jgi:hypothetical protein
MYKAFLRNFVQFENNKKIEPPSNKLRFVHLFEEK